MVCYLNRGSVKGLGYRLPIIKLVGWKSAAPSTNAKALTIPRYLLKHTPKNASFFGLGLRISVVNCYWVEMPEGAALFRPTCLGIGGGLVFGGECALPV